MFVQKSFKMGKRTAPVIMVLKFIFLATITMGVALIVIKCLKSASTSPLVSRALTFLGFCVTFNLSRQVEIGICCLKIPARGTIDFRSCSSKDGQVMVHSIVMSLIRPF